MTKIHRHVPSARSHPAANGAVSEATPVKPDQIPTARDRSSGLKLDWMIARLAGSIRAPPMPWSERAPMSASMPGAMAHSTDAPANPATPVRKTRRRP